MAREKHCTVCPCPMEQKLSAARLARSRSRNAVSWASHFCGGRLPVSCKGQGTGQRGVSNGAVEPLTWIDLGQAERNTKLLPTKAKLAVKKQIDGDSNC